MSMVQQAVLKADLTFIEKVLGAIEQAAKERQEALHLTHVDYVSQDLKETVDTLQLRKISIEAKLQRIRLAAQ